MKLLILTLLVVPVVLGGALPAPAQTQSNTYPETRKLLLAMDRDSTNKEFKKLFEEADLRQSDLIQALYDPERVISLNAQSIILYLADPQALAALEKWFEYRRTHTNESWMSPVKLVADIKFLTGGDGDLGNLVVKNLHPNEKDFWAKVIAYNKRTDTAIR